MKIGINIKTFLFATSIAITLSACSGTTEIGDGDGSGGNNEPVFPGEYVVLSQDTYDSDNFSLAVAAQRMDEAGIIKLLGIDITGRDTGGYGGLLFSISLGGKDVPILINQDPQITRTTPSSNNYTRLNEFPSDGLTDAQRPDSTLELANILRNAPKPITYVVGGHLHNLASLMKYDMALVKEKIKSVVIFTGWSSKTDGKAETNLSEGQYKPTGTSAATIYVFENLPSNIKLILAGAPNKASTGRVSFSDLDPESGFYYLLYNGHYTNHKDIGLGDFKALLWAVNNSPVWSGQQWGTEVKTCFKLTDYGATIATNDCDKNQWYIDKHDYSIPLQVFKEFVKKQ